MTYKEFKTEFENNILPNKPTFIRDGQALMNYLSGVWFEEYKRISAIDYYDEKNIDCFYKDSLMANTLEHLEKVWKNYPN